MTSQFDYDLVLMDCHMPEMDGIEATKVIRQRKSQRGNSLHPPVLAVIASVLPEDTAECLDAGMDGLIPKPFMLRDLEQALSRWSRATRCLAA